MKIFTLISVLALFMTNTVAAQNRETNSSNCQNNKNDSYHCHHSQNNNSSKASSSLRSNSKQGTVKVNKSVSHNHNQPYDKTFVRKVQKNLNRQGYNAGFEDGIYGSKTKSAVLKYQQDKGIQPNEKLSNNLLNELSR